MRTAYYADKSLDFGNPSLYAESFSFKAPENHIRITRRQAVQIYGIRAVEEARSLFQTETNADGIPI